MGPRTNFSAKVGYYSIKDLERISGIKAHTLRAWEQRYNLFEPNRTSTNIRYYSDLDLRYLLNVATLNNNGVRISRIAKMSPGEVHEAVLSLNSDNPEVETQINALLISMVEVDEARFEQVVSSHVIRVGFEETMFRLIYPFFEKLGVLWQTGSITPAQEHFISNLVRQKLIVAMDGQPNRKREGGGLWILFTPEGEQHELSLLFAAFLLRNRGHEVIYLGASLPQEDLASIIEVRRPDYLLTALTINSFNEPVARFFDKIATQYPDIRLVVGGQALREQELKLPANAMHFSDIQEFLSFLQKKD